MGTFTTRIIRACLRPAAAASSGKAVKAMMGFLSGYRATWSSSGLR
jgi:hypothetical protein